MSYEINPFTGKLDKVVSVASSITTDISNFDGILSAADDTVQKALDTLDNLDLSGYVPYTGAANDVDLGAHTIDTAGYICSADGLEIDTARSFWPFKFDAALAPTIPDPTGFYFNFSTSAMEMWIGTRFMQFHTGGYLRGPVAAAFYIEGTAGGAGAAGQALYLRGGAGGSGDTDGGALHLKAGAGSGSGSSGKITFDEALATDDGIITEWVATSATGVFSWIGSLGGGDMFKFSDDVLWGANEKAMFRDEDLYIHSFADGELDEVADVKIKLTAPTIQLVASTLVDVDGDLDVSGYIKTGGNELWAMDIIRHTLEAGDLTTFTEAWNTATTKKVVSMTAVIVDESAANDPMYSQQESWSANTEIALSYDGTNITCTKYRYAAGMDWAVGDIVTITVIYEK